MGDTGLLNLLALPCGHVVNINGSARRLVLLELRSWDLLVDAGRNGGRSLQQLYDRHLHNGRRINCVLLLRRWNLFKQRFGNQ